MTNSIKAVALFKAEQRSARVGSRRSTDGAARFNPRSFALRQAYGRRYRLDLVVAS
jgi:hypothetical protein